MKRESLADQIINYHGGDLTALERTFARHDPEGAGLMDHTRFAIAVRETGLSLTSNQIDQIIFEFPRDDKFCYRDFLDCLAQEVEERKAALQDSKIRRPRTALDRQWSGSRLATAGAAAEKPPAEARTVELADALEMLRGAAEEWPLKKLWAKFDFVHRGDLDLAEFTRGVRDELGLRAAVLPDAAVAEVFAAFAGGARRTLGRKKFAAVFAFEQRDGIQDVRRDVHEFMTTRFRSVFAGFSALTDPILGYVSVASMRKFLAERLPGTPAAEREAFVAACAGGDGYLAASEIIEYSAFLDVLRSASVASTPILSPSASAAGVATPSTPATPTTPPRAPAEEDERGAIRAIRAEILDAANNSVTKIRHSLVLQARASGDDAGARISPDALIRVLVHGLRCRFSTPQKTFIAAHCVDAASGQIPVEDFIAFYRLDRITCDPEVPAQLLVAARPASSISAESPAEAHPRRTRSVYENTYDSAGLRASFAAEAAEAAPAYRPTETERAVKGEAVPAAASPVYRPTESERIMSEAPRAPPRTSGRPGSARPSTIGAVIGGTAARAPEPLYAATQGVFRRAPAK
eukprot:gnl/Chilomastix_cuspidata/1333.p1 GENE.gnl/Chilomastix_cuspidata/1333~~gnl/Chilomastix_cuspidata/1333.p1  ORF type:complete len:578 (+),score=318.36 gnl/Chilomastix_cuspidata/1333:1429-3162(+)